MEPHPIHNLVSARDHAVALVTALERENESLRRTLYLHRLIDAFCGFLLLVVGLTVFVTVQL